MPEDDVELQAEIADVQAEAETAAPDDTQATPEINAALGVDPENLPPELEPHYKNMLRGMNRKMRELASEKKEMQALRQKAQAMDMVMANPALLRDMLTRQGVNIEPPNAGNGKSAPDPLDEIEPEKVLHNDGILVIRRLIRDALKQAKETEFLPAMAELQGFVQEQKRGKLKSEWESLLDEYPDADDVKTDIAALMDRGLGVKQAYYALRGDEVVANKKAQAVQAKKKAQLGRPGIPETGRKLVGQPKSLRDMIMGSWHTVQPQFAPTETE